MNVLIACDKFKSSLSAVDVCESIARGLSKTNQGLQIDIHPIADGGDGTLAVLKEHLDLSDIQVNTIDPLHREILANYASDGKIAFIELATASGIERLDQDEYNPMTTTTIGTGKLIEHAIKNGHEEIALAIGGSCTTDAGLGIAYALGFKFINKEGSDIVPMGGTLNHIERIKPPKNPINTTFKILCDVDNPFFGPDGAAYVFSPQKGANEEQVIELDNGLRHVAKLIHKFNGKEIGTLKGGGAAGGIAAGLNGLLNASLVSGFTFLSDVSGLLEKIAWADIVITGEGKLDSQSFGGKVVGQLIIMCKASNTPIIAIVGKNELKRNDQFAKYFLDILSISDFAKNLEDAMSHASQYLTKIGSEINLFT